MRRAWVDYTRAGGRDWAKQRIAAIQSERSLRAFVRLMWPVLHPERPLVEGWALHAILDHLEAVASGDIKKLLINVPPGCMKSLAVNVFLPAWLWGPRGQAHKQVISWSYAEQLTIRDNRRFRRLIRSDLYQRHWGDCFYFSKDQDEKRYLENNHTGFKFAAGIHGGGTGHRGDLLIWDDPHKVKEAESDLNRESANQWLTETLPTRKNDNDAAFIGIMQRIHERDCSGTVLADPECLGYEHLCLPMEYEHDHPHPSRTSLHFQDPRTKDGELLWPQRFPREEVEDLKRTMRTWGGTYAEQGQFQQRPAPRGGGMFKRKDFVIVDQAPPCIAVARGWDLAATSAKKNPGAAYTAGVKMGITADKRIVVLDVVRVQDDPNAVNELLVATAKADGYAVVQDIPEDPGQSGKHQATHLAQLLMGFVCMFGKETGSKPSRARPFASQVEAGNVMVVRAPWIDAYVAEAEVFPNGRFMDQIDASSRAMARLLIMAAGGIGDFAMPELYEGADY